MLDQTPTQAGHGARVEPLLPDRYDQPLFHQPRKDRSQLFGRKPRALQQGKFAHPFEADLGEQAHHFTGGPFHRRQGACRKIYKTRDIAFHNDRLAGSAFARGQADGLGRDRRRAAQGQLLP